MRRLTLSVLAATAVALPASSFPGGLTTLTFRNYAGSCQYRQSAWVDKLRAVGRRPLSEDPQFQNLLKALNGCLSPVAGRTAEAQMNYLCHGSARR